MAEKIELVVCDMAGTTVLDLQAGHNAGVALNIGVLSGAHGRDQMQPHPHTHLLDSVAAIPELLTRRHQATVA